MSGVHRSGAASSYALQGWRQLCVVAASMLVGLIQTPLSVAATPVPLGEIPVGSSPGALIPLPRGRIWTILATPGGKRTVVIADRSSRISIYVVDTERPDAPRLEGHIDLRTKDVGVAASSFDNGVGAGTILKAALSPDGRRLLLSTSHQSVNEAAVALVDLSDPVAPRFVCEAPTDALFTIIALANDAGTYAFDDPKIDSLLVAQPCAASTRAVRLGDSVNAGSLMLSDDGKLLLDFWGSGLAAIDLRSGKPMTYTDEEVEEKWGEQHGDNGLEDVNVPNMYACATLLDNGVLVAAGGENHGQVRILTAEGSQLSVTSTLDVPVDSSNICNPLNRNASTRDLLFWSPTGMIARMDLRDPRHPSVDGYWITSSNPWAVAGSILFSGDRIHAVKISRLEWADRSPVDWRQLDAVYTGAEQSRDLKERADAVAAFEATGIFNAISAPVSGVTPERAARILRYYGRLMQSASASPCFPSAPWYCRDLARTATHSISIPQEVGESALRRANELDPHSGK